MDFSRAAHIPDKPNAAAATRLLLIDDDTELCELLTEYLGTAGFSVAVAHDADAGLGRALGGEYGLIILDVMLPGLNGFEILKRIRARSAVPVLMLTARGDEVDRIVGLEIGADDYLPKPFNPRELVARIQAILRRAGTPRPLNGASGPAERVVVGDVDLDSRARVVHCAGRVVELTGAEFALLETLLREAGRVVPRDDLSKTALGRRLVPFDRSIDMHMSNLRKKLGPGPGGNERIKTVRSMGYIYTVGDPPP
jgi:two-component system, OmpR family, response regulator CpxR